jgi:hypothetical protein
MDKPYIVDFGEGEERWQDAELGKKWTGWIQEQIKNQDSLLQRNPKLTRWPDKHFAEQAAKKYKNELIHRFLDENPSTPTFEGQDFEQEGEDEDFIRRHFKLSPKDVVTPSHNNWLRAWKIANDLVEEDAEPSIFGSLDNRYNRTTLEENKAWEAARAKTPVEEYKPMVLQSTSPSRLQSLGVFGQQIDPNVPIFLQKANPHIPWGVNHPLKKLYRKHALTRRATEDREEYEYDAMEKLNNPRYLEEEMYKDKDIDGEPWFHQADMAKEVKTFGYTPFLIDKMQTERQKSLLDLYEKVPPIDE